MIKEILFDADGVVVKNRGKFFSERFSEEYNVPLEQVSTFFKTEYGKCARGQADLKEVLPSYLEQWGWNGTLDEFLTYWFESERELETRLLDEVDELRGKGIGCHIVSDNEKYRAEYLMVETEMGEHFDGAFFSCELGHKKSEQDFFNVVLERLGLTPAEVMYWDDDPKNIEIAKQLGIDGRTYTTFEDFQENLNV